MRFKWNKKTENTNRKQTCFYLFDLFQAGGGLMTTSSVFWSKRKQNQNQKLCQVDEKWSETGRDVMLTSK